MDEKPTVVLDLDLTVVHTVSETIPKKIHKDRLYKIEKNVINNINMLFHPAFSFLLPVGQISNFMTNAVRYHVFLRPHLFYFLYTIKKHFNIIIYTHATEVYALIILKYINYILDTYYNTSSIDSWNLNPELPDFFDIIIARKTNTSPRIKSLYNINSINLKNIIIIDDNPDAWDDVFHNILYKIPPFNYKNFNDNVLLEL